MRKHQPLRHAELAVFLLTATYLGAQRAALPTNTNDALRDHLLGHTAVAGVGVVAEGPTASQLQMVQGTLWPDMIGLVRLAGGAERELSALLVLLTACAAVLMLRLSRELLPAASALLPTVVYVLAFPLTYEMSTGTNPEPMALFSVLFFFSLWRLVRDGHGAHAAAAGAMLACCVDTHVAAYVLTPAFGAALLLSSVRPVTGVLAGVGGFALTALAVSATALWQNLEALASLPRAGGLLVATAAACAALLVLRPRWRGLTPRLRFALLGVAASLPLVAFLVMRQLEQAPWAARYAASHAPLWALAVGAVAALAIRPRLQPAATALVALGIVLVVRPTLGGEPNPEWLASMRTGALLAERGYSYGELYRHLQSADRQRHLGGYLLQLRAPPDVTVREGTGDLVVLRLPAGTAPEPVPEAASVVALPDGEHLLVREAPTSVDRTTVEVCGRDGSSRERCWRGRLDPRTHRDQLDPPGLVGLDVPRLLFEEDPPGLAVTAYRLTVNVPEGQAREFDLLDEPGPCAWHVARDEDGTLEPARRAVRLLGSGAPVMLELRRPPECAAEHRFIDLPPPLLETADDEARLRELVRGPTGGLG